MSFLDDLGGSSGALLLQRARNGDGAAFGALYQQHLAVARRLARSLVADRNDADDVVAEVFAAAFAAMRRGRGPVDDFRSYLLTSVRRECQRTWRRSARQRPAGDVVVDLGTARSTARDDFAWFDESDVVHRAFAALAPRMQHVMWLTEIEGLSHDEVAVRLGTSSTNVAQLARRARLAFGERYLDAHLPTPDDPVPATCIAPRRILAEVVRGTASRRAERVAAEHMAACRSCSDAESELRVVNGRLRTGHLFVLLPALTVSRPARIGLFARLLAWVAGPVPTMSAVATLAVASAVVPHEPWAAAAAPEPAVEAIVTPTTTTGVPIDLGAAPRGRPVVDPNTFDPTSGGSRWLPAPFDAAASSAPADQGPLVPTDGSTSDSLPTVETSPDGGTPGDTPPGVLPPATPPDASPTGQPPLLDVPGAVEGAVRGITLDDPVVDALTPVVAALPPLSVSVTVPPTPQLAPIGPTPQVSLDADGSGGEVAVGAGAGPLDLGVRVGGSDGIGVDLPAPADVVAVLPAPVPAAVGNVPLVGSLVVGR